MEDILVNNDSLLDSGDEEEAMTAADVLEKIEELWITEKMSPNLEPHHIELIDCMLDQLSQMTENLKRCKKNDFRLAIHKLEIDRIRYIISSYLRTRLKKIERFSHHLVDLQSRQTDESKPALLSPEECRYAKEFQHSFGSMRLIILIRMLKILLLDTELLSRYASNLDAHLNLLGTEHMPENLQSLEKATMSVKPNLDSYVFFRVKKDVEGLLIEDNTGEGRDEQVDLEIGQQHLMRYSTISQLLQETSINLI